MDIIDVILAKALTPQQLADYIAQAQRAVSIATTAANNIDAITAQTNENNANSITALSNVNAALNNIAAAADTEIKKLTLAKTSSTSGSTISTDLQLNYPDNTSSTLNSIVKYYTSTGNASDGTMTQAAISAIFTSINQTLTQVNADIEYLKEHGGSGGGGGSSNLGPANKGKIVVVGPNGNIAPGAITEEAIVAALIKSGDYVLDGAIGLSSDYENRTFTRIQEAIPLSMGTDFDKYDMYGGRMRCNVNNEGRITAWYGDNNYTEDGSNGQVMVYQPKFYYMRSYDKIDVLDIGTAIRKETLILSDVPAPGFKLHPLFIAPDGTELDYVLISAYEGCAQVNNDYIQNDSNVDLGTAKLSSIAGVQPISGLNNNFTVFNAEQTAQNRGSNWHITNMSFESAMQMLQTVEYGMPNGQAALEKGICNITNYTNRNCSSLTGSTSSLGNASGVAESTTNTSEGSARVYTEEGKRAISYRGVENPWGNIWRLVGGANVVGNGAQAGGILYICTNFNYSAETSPANYESIGFALPKLPDWISAFGKPAEKYDWVYMPIETSNANSAVPIGDNVWVNNNLNTTNLVTAGGPWHFAENDGMYYYGCDQQINTIARSISARLMYIPVTKDSIYQSNLSDWRSRRG